MDEEEDEYIFYGTPLPEIEDETTLRKRAARELEVRDEKGRQRFHGAFTGGFSAGYFNTVGTKEGWAPSTFVSSRSKVADRVQQNPEDFMDGDDFGEFGIATRRIHTTSKFDDSSNSEARKRKFPELDSAIPGEAPLKDLIKPVSKSIGIQILNKLGWRFGQGIGPRVKKHQVGSAKVYGCSPFPDCTVPEEEDPGALSFTFAPKDTIAEFFKPKDDVFGLGYTGLSKESVLSARVDTFNPTSTKSYLKKDKRKLTISGQAFGVGAFEDDDEDIYSKDDMSQYDFSELNTNESAQMSKDKELKKLHGSSNEVLEGFCLATQPPPIKKHYPPPELPRHYRPVCSMLPKVTVQAASKFTSRHSLSAGDRSLLLGEKKFESFQITSEKEKKVVEAKPDPADKLKIPSVQSNSHSFRPFLNDELKQKRYEEYLKLKILGEISKLKQPSSMTEWEKQQELEEFSRASVIYKPSSAFFSSKFESKSHLSVEHEVMDALSKAKKESTQKAIKERRKLIGTHNRKTVEWHPVSLLCKRFNVPNPYPNSSEVPSSSQKSRSLFDHISFQTREVEQPHVPSSGISPDDKSSKNISEPMEILLNNDAPSLNKEVEKVMQVQVPSTESKKPPIDFFKDIFENSSSEDEEIPATEPKTQSDSVIPKSPTKPDVTMKENNTTPNLDEKSPVSKPSVSNKKSGFGVFANLDLDALNQRPPAKATRVQESIDSIDSNHKTKKETEDHAEEVVHVPEEKQQLPNYLYGPELPPDYSEPSISRSSEILHRKHAKHKLKHKHKHHKHKSKKKKKRKSSHKSSGDSSFDSDEDIPAMVILEKLKKLKNVLKNDL